MSKLSIAVLVPARNEAGVIASTLKALLKLVPPSSLYVVDDGSKDKTRRIAKKYTDNVLQTHNRGKAQALNFGIKHFKLTKRYRFILFMDADTQPKPDFLQVAVRHFKKDPKKQIVCVIGRIKGYGTNAISKYRQWEYQISHLVHKRAQWYLSSILVVPGCATLYRSEVFDKLQFPTGTLTEDMDFTFLMHRSGIGKMVFENKAIVYTQDPRNISDFVKQISRWYTGFWQVVRKHGVPWQGQMLDMEATMLALEGLYNGLIVIGFCGLIVPLALLGNLRILAIPLFLDLFLFFIPTLIWNSVSDKDYTRMLYIPQFYFLRFLSSIIFLKSFFVGYLSQEKDYIWDSARYSLMKRSV